ncbi:AAA family ATPase, partial [Candidatus Babeliales bacterium]|nr:AAA family ATPase [Candidatus Babeliales bacterium]
MNFILKRSLILIFFGVYGVEARDKTYFQQAKAAIVGVYDQYVQWQEDKRKRQEEKEKQEKEDQELLQQMLEEADCIIQEKEKKEREEKKQQEELEKFCKESEFKYYFERQERIYQALVNLGIPGARPLSIDADLAESVLSISSKKVRDIVIDIEQRVLFKNKKNIIFYGPSGTGKSVLAQAIAIKCKIPCLFFNAGTI